MKKLGSYFRVLFALCILIASGQAIRAVSGCSSNIPGLNICDGGVCKVDVDVNVNWRGSSGIASSSTARAPVHISPIASSQAVSIMFSDTTVAILPNPSSSSNINPIVIGGRGL